MNRIHWRRDYAYKWAQVNPVLDIGEPGYEINTGRFKIGDGESRWLDLEYFSPGSLDAAQQLELELQNHIDSLTPHPAYDDGPSFLLLYQNAKV